MESLVRGIIGSNVIAFCTLEARLWKAGPLKNIIVLEDNQYQLLMRSKEENRKRWASKRVY
jgi:hypothetical protein